MVSKDRGWQNKCNVKEVINIIDFINLAVTHLDILPYAWAESGELVSSLAVQCCAMLATRLSIQPILLDIYYTYYYTYIRLHDNIVMTEA